MSKNDKTVHVYERAVHDNCNDSIYLLASFVKPNDVVLDLGMGTGVLGRHLAQQQAVTLDGVTLSLEEAQMAANIYRQIEVADLDQIDLDKVFDGKTYDAIVCADVLEHLKNPERLLQQIHTLLKPGGQLLTSVPNVAYCGLLAELFQGEFRYREEGLLDKTHLRFFTRQSLARFYTHHGWRIKQTLTTTRDLLSSEFQGRLDQLPPAVARHLLALPDASTYQFISTLEPMPSADVALIHLPQIGSPAQALYSAQLYLAIDGRYTESQKLVQPGIMGDGMQTIQFDIPALSDGQYTRIRLDPADRPGFMHLQSLNIRTQGDTEKIWDWRASASRMLELETAPQQEILWSPPWGPTEQAWLQILGNDPWIELPLDLDMLQDLSKKGGQVTMLASWPMSADYLQANANFEIQTSKALAREKNANLILESAKEIAEKNNELQAEINQLNVLLQQVETEVIDKNLKLAQLYNLKQSLEQTEKINKRLSMKIMSTEQIKNQTIQELSNARVELENAKSYIKRIEKSKLFTYTRPLAHFKYKLDALLRRHPVVSSSLKEDASLNALPLPVIDEIPLPQHPIDVIVPVYRGLEDTQRCINSALASTCQTAWHMVIINDCSPEPEITQWLRETASNDTRITLIENPENLGFVATVNRGMSLHPERDVLLLNSDAEVANDWLDRIQRAAYSRPQVASVTPFSNNATICSYPKFCEVNDLPDGWSTGQLDQLCAEHLKGQAVQVPTGIGFCMFIRRSCLDEVGLFDVENFGKGYGEENDFCVRAEKAGWVNLHALDCFVRHAGGVSFGDSKSERETKAMETIRRLHPLYERDVQIYVQRDPAQQARLTLDLARLVCGGRITILNVMHNRAGGTVRHLEDMAKAFAGQAHFLTLTPADGGLHLRLAGPSETFALQWPSLEPANWGHFLRTLKQLGVVHVHYHHLMGHAPQVQTLHESLGVTHDFTAHDYYSVCPQITLTDSQDRYCGEEGHDQCQNCLKGRPAPGGVNIHEWRDQALALLNTARHVFTPSQDTWRRMQAYAPDACVTYAPHLSFEGEPIAVQTKSLHDRPLKVIVLGGLSKIKGADTLEDVATLARRQGLPLEFHLLGYGYRALRTQPRANLSVHGAYQEADLPELLAWLNADLAWFPAQCPETFSYTLSAAIGAGLPVMASDLGALSDRLQGRSWTWLVDWQSSPAQWVQHLLEARQQISDGVSPSLCTASGSAHSAVQFDYPKKYLVDLENNKDSSTVQRLHALLHELSSTSSVSIKSSAEPRVLLQMLQWLRQQAVLGRVAKLIPGHVQRRIKSYLIG